MHEPPTFPALLEFLTVPVSEMFRDPSYFRSLREQVVPLLRTYPSLKVWVAGCSTGEEAYSLAILLREEGLLDAHADLRDRHQPRYAAEGARPASTTSIASQASRRTIAARARRRRCRTTTRPRYGRAVFDKSLKTAHRVLRSQPGHRQRFRRGAARLLPQRADLLQPRAAGPGDRAVQRRALPQGVPRHRCEGVAALLAASRTRSSTSSREERIFQKKDAA